MASADSKQQVDAPEVERRARYGVTASLAMVLILWILAGPEKASTLYYAVIDGISIALVLASSHVARRARWLRPISWSIALLGVIVLLTPLFLDDGAARRSTSVSLLLVSIYVPILILRGLRTRRRADAQLVLAAITIYLLIGIFSAVALSLAGSLQSDQLLNIGSTAAGEAQLTDGTFRQQAYLSFVTLSTVGYGDITPASGTARAIALFTALMGQLYLVVAVATAVTMVAADRSHARERN